MVSTSSDGRALHDAPSVDLHDRQRSDYRPLTELFRELRDETTDLVRNEVKLAKIELGEKVSRVGRNSAYAALGSIFSTAALVILMFAAAAGVYAALVEGAGLAHMTSGWLAPLIVGGIGLLIGLALLWKGLRTISSESVVPQRTVDSLRDDKQWVERKVG
ncbi:MAG: phage holin family protein [Pirellulales bacterium]|nr:phage holin family protein [Pirellulales bacterium]